MLQLIFLLKVTVYGHCFVACPPSHFPQHTSFVNIKVAHTAAIPNTLILLVVTVQHI